MSETETLRKQVNVHLSISTIERVLRMIWQEYQDKWTFKQVTKDNHNEKCGYVMVSFTSFQDLTLRLLEYKLIMQELWKFNISWYEQIPQKLQDLKGKMRWWRYLMLAWLHSGKCWLHWWLYWWLHSRKNAHLWVEKTLTLEWKKCSR